MIHHLSRYGRVRGIDIDPRPVAAAGPFRLECAPAGEADGVARFRVRCEAGTDPREALAAAVADHRWGLLELHAERLSLEDVFLKLTAGEGK